MYKVFVNAAMHPTYILLSEDGLPSLRVRTREAIRVGGTIQRQVLWPVLRFPVRRCARAFRAP